MTTLSVEQLWNHDILQHLRASCSKGEVEESTLFKVVDALLCTIEEFQEVSEASRKQYAGKLTGRLRTLIPRQVSPSPKAVLDIDSLPTPLYQILQFYHGESNSFRKVHRLIDLFEWSIKWHTVLTMSDLLQEKAISDELKVLFSSGLRVPTLGRWMQFFRVSMEALNKPSFPWKEWECLLELEKKHHIVNFRNGYAHGATPSDEDCEKDCVRLFPILQKVISSPLFSQLQMVYEEKGKAYRWVGDKKYPSELSIFEGYVHVVHRDQPDKVALTLWPIGLASIDPKNLEKGRQFFYFNALKNQSIEQLNYAWGLHFRDKSLWEHFHEVIPIDDWKDVSSPKLDIFRERVEALTEVFKGRLVEREMLREFCLCGTGNQMVWGPPGIGKSALLAQVLKEIRGRVDAAGAQFEDHYPTIIPYFIRRGTETAMPEKFLRYLCQEFDKVYHLKDMGLGNGTQELSEALQLRLQAISGLDAPQRSVLFIDGLDEGIEKTIGILRFIPSSNSWLSVLCASRYVPEVERWYHRRANRKDYTVGPLSASDIRAMLYDVVDKYDEGLSQEYIKALEKVSSGNPLYLKLLCDQLYAGVRKVGSVDDLPKEMSDLYKEVLHRVTDGGRNENAYRLLLLLTETKASLSVEVVSEFLGISEMAAETAIDDCMELLFEDPITLDILDYQLFHESLRSYLRETKVKDTRKMAVHVTDVCYRWQNLDGHTLRYALEFLAGHLQAHNDEERIWLLLKDESFRKEQIRVSRLFTFSYESIVVGLKTYVEKEEHSPQDDGRLCWLVLRAGELAREAIEGVDIAFEWFKEDALELDNVFKRIEVLDEGNYFKACLRLMMVEAWRQQDWDETRRAISIPQKILEQLDERIPEGRGTVDLIKFIPFELINWWAFLMLQTWKDIDLGSVYRRAKPSEVYNIQSNLIKRLLEQGMIEQAITTANRISHDLHKSKALLRIVRALSEQGMIGQSKKLFEQSLTVVNRISHDFHKSEAIESIVRALSEQGMIEQAITTANRISHDFHKSKAIVFIAKSLSEQGMIEQSLTIVHSLSDDFRKSEALMAIAKSLSEQGMIEQSLTIVNRISHDFHKSEAIESIAKCLAECGMTERSKDIFEQVIEITQQISGDFRKSEVLMAIAKYLAECGMTERSKGIFEQVIEMIQKSSHDVQKLKALANIGKNLTEAGMTERSKDIFEQVIQTAQISNDRDKSRLLAYIAKCLTEAGMTERSKDVFEQVIERSQKSSYDTQEIRALANIGKCLAECGMTERSKDIFEQVIQTAQISNDRDKSRLLTYIAKCLAECGMTERFKGIFEQVIEMTQKSSHDVQKLKALADIGKCLAEAGMLEQSRGIFEQVIQTAQISNDRDKSRLLAYIAKCLAEAGMTERSKDVFEQAIDAAPVANAGSKASVLAEIAKYLAKCSATEHSKNLFEQAILTAYKISSERSKSRILTGIGKRLTEAGMLERSKAIFEQVIEITQQISYDAQKIRAFAAISNCLAQQGMIEQSISVTQKISDDRIKSWAHANIAKCLADQGMFKQSIDMIQKLSDDRIKSGIFVYVADSLSKQGRSSLLQHLHKSSHSTLFYESFLSHYQKTLTETQLIRASFLYSPFSYQLSQTSVHHFLCHHLLLQEESDFHAIIEHCPQLELDYLLPSTPTTAYTYATWKDWIDTIEDEDDADDIRSWARRVKKGRMTEKEFTERVQDLLS